MGRILSYFQLHERQTTVTRELRGAVATFLTMAYILVVNAGILSSAGVPFAQAVACTALAAGVCSILMGIFANFPIALASGMGLNAIVAFAIVPAAGSWQVAMGVIVLDGIITTLLVLAGLREAVMNAIPRSLRMATGAGIGLFIAFIGLVNARIVIVPKGTVFKLWETPGATMPPVAPGSLRDPVTYVALAGLLIMSILLARKIKGALVIGIFATTILGLSVGVAKLPAWEALSWPSFSGVAFAADIRGALQWKLTSSRRRLGAIL